MIPTDVMRIARYSDLDTRMAEFEEQLRRDPQSSRLCRDAKPAVPPRRGTREFAEKAPLSGMVQSKVTPTIVAGVCDPGVDNCRPQRDRLQAGPITACAMIPSVTQEWVFLNHAHFLPLSAAARSSRKSR